MTFTLRDLACIGRELFYRSRTITYSPGFLDDPIAT
jgi:hypothetical protein